MESMDCGFESRKLIDQPGFLIMFYKETEEIPMEPRITASVEMLLYSFEATFEFGGSDLNKGRSSVRTGMRYICGQ